MKILLIIATVLNLVLSSGTDASKQAIKMQVYQCGKPIEGSNHILVLTSVNGKHSGHYLGSEKFRLYLQNSMTEDTIYYFTELKNLVVGNDGHIQFTVSPTEAYTEPFLVDSSGNIIKRPGIRTNNVSGELRYGFNYTGNISDKAIILRRHSDKYRFSSSETFHFYLR